LFLVIQTASFLECGGKQLALCFNEHVGQESAAHPAFLRPYPVRRIEIGIAIGIPMSIPISGMTYPNQPGRCGSLNIDTPWNRLGLVSQGIPAHRAQQAMDRWTRFTWCNLTNRRGTETSAE